MRINSQSAIMIGVGLAVGSFIYQAAQPVPDWSVAAERGFFQITSVLWASIVWSRGQQS